MRNFLAILFLLVPLWVSAETVANPRKAPSEKSSSGEVGNIPSEDIHTLETRKKALRLTGVGFGPFGSSKVGEDALLYGFTYSNHWETSVTGEIHLDFMGVFNSNDAFWNAGLGYAWLPSTQDFSPVLGGSLGLGFSSTNSGEYAAGFSGQVYGGMRLFRLSDVQMEVLVRYSTVFDSPTPGVYGALLRVLF